MAALGPMGLNGLNEVVNNIDWSAIQIISEIEKDLNANDVISILFLIFEDLQLLMLLLLDKDLSPLDIIRDWALRNSPNWKQVLLEALTIAQQFKILRKLGSQSRHCEGFYIKPINKILYRLCENITADNLGLIRNQLCELDINIRDTDTNEEILLKLLKEKLICFKPGECKLELMSSILDNIPGLQRFASELREYEIELCSENLHMVTQREDNTNTGIDGDGSLLSTNCVMQETCVPTPNSQVKLKRTLVDSLIECHPITEFERKGVCLIINQETFHSTDGSQPLEERKGSSLDKKKLYCCMTRLKYKVFHQDNLTVKQMLSFIVNVIIKQMLPSDSIFMLYILSHGVRGHVFGADGLKFNVADIQNVISSKLKSRQFNIPKIMFLQACQVDECNTSNSTILYEAVGDEFVVVSATKPGFKTHRYKSFITGKYLGSVAVGVFCDTLQKYANQLHILELYTAFNRNLKKLTKQLQGFEEGAHLHTTFSKLLYLQMPNVDDEDL